MENSTRIFIFIFYETPYFALKILIGSIIVFSMFVGFSLLSGNEYSMAGLVSGLKTTGAFAGLFLIVSTFGNGLVKYLYLREHTVTAKRIWSGDISIQQAQSEYLNNEQVSE